MEKMFKKNLIFLFLLVLIPLASAVETSSTNYQAKIIIFPGGSLSSDSYKSRVIVGESAVENISSENYKIWVGFIYGTTTTIPELPGGTISQVTDTKCGAGWYLRDGICVRKKVFIRIIETIRVNFLIYFLLGVIASLCVNYLYYKKKEKENEKDSDD